MGRARGYQNTAAAAGRRVATDRFERLLGDERGIDDDSHYRTRASQSLTVTLGRELADLVEQARELATKRPEMRSDWRAHPDYLQHLRLREAAREEWRRVDGSGLVLGKDDDARRAADIVRADGWNSEFVEAFSIACRVAAQREQFERSGADIETLTAPWRAFCAAD